MSGEGQYTYKWPRPSVTVDLLIHTVKERKVWLLLIQRKHDPFQGSWALPGEWSSSGSSSSGGGGSIGGSEGVVEPVLVVVGSNSIHDTS